MFDLCSTPGMLVALVIFAIGFRKLGSVASANPEVSKGAAKLIFRSIFKR